MAFDLSSISTTKRKRAPKVVICGPGKIGKTTFASMAKNSVGILTEEGADNVDAQAFPLCTTMQDVYEAIGTLLSEEHTFENVFIDSVDWLEPMLHQHVCSANNWNNIESPGYGKGYIAAAEEWRVLLSGLEMLRSQKNMGVYLIAHDKIKRIDDPLTEGYDAHQLKLHDRAAALVMEWADVIGFAGYQVFINKTDSGFGQKENKAVTSGTRILYVEPHPAHCGGNRVGLTNMPLDYTAFADALSAI
jgi:hypothetical protein